MNEQTLRNCEQLIANRDKLSAAFKWENALMHLSCAEIYLSKGKEVDKDALETCRKLLKNKLGAFSTFRGMVQTPITAMLAVSENPEELLDNAVKVYELLKKHFSASNYLPVAAMMIAQTEEPYRYEQIVTRTHTLYKLMKEKHRFLTSEEDSTFCALMALSEKSDSELIAEAEKCFTILKGKGFSANAVQSLGNVLALCDGTAEEKCEKTMQLFDKLKAAKHRYGKEYELPTLGILAMSGEDLDSIVQEMAEIDNWLAKQKGFGMWSGISEQQRLMYAGMIAQKKVVNHDTMQAAAIGGTIAMVVAQQAAMCAILAGTMAATTVSST